MSDAEDIKLATISDQATNLARRVNVGDITRRGARRHRDKIAVIMGETRLTYGELDARANRIAHGLLAMGLGNGARIGGLARNSIDFLTLYFAAAKAGAIFCPSNPAIPDADLVHILGHAEVSAIFIDPDRHQQFTAVASQVPSIRKIFSVGGNGQADSQLDSLAVIAEGQPAIDPETVTGDRDVAMIMYTSGTTSAPKGAMLSHINVTTGAVHNAFAGEVDENTIATAILPLFHCGQLSISSGTLMRGGTVVVFDGFEPAALLDAIARERITWLFALPAMYRALLAHKDLDNTDVSSLAFCLYAMAPMDPSTLREASRRLKARFALTSGQTEAYPPTVVFAPEFQLTKHGAFWGRAMPLVDLAIMDDDGRLVEDGSVGEIVYRGPMVMEGYLKDPEATARAFEGGWFHSGDLGRFDEDSLLLFVDRKKDIIKSGGENVSSVKVESCLLAHPAVRAAAIVGVPHSRWSEAVVAAVCLLPGSVEDEGQLIAHCKQTLAPFEVPKKIVFYRELPQTATGKLQKYQIRGELENLFRDQTN
ncbi:AMP-binding protein [Rhodopseudomonas pseudopalustris]|nr:AMP-binding protein [Rhodopseudomonas pseudopalustris]